MDPIIKFSVYVPFDDEESIFTTGDEHVQLAIDVELNLNENSGKLTYGGRTMTADGDVRGIQTTELNIE